MSSKHLRGDVNYAWPTAEIAVMGGSGPPVVKTFFDDGATTETLGGATVHCTKSGVAQFSVSDEEAGIA
ncbi:MAG: hypothetical protein K5885_09855, partial [Bacteroidales bacterium]|nr:hypothetical protein [Bacteroidales bacterium]